MTNQESEHNADYRLPILSERAVYDEIMKDTFKGCIDTQRIRICSCDRCTPMRRATCQVPKSFQERYPDWEEWSK